MPNSDIAALGKQIRSARKKADLTQEQLSALCHVSTKHIANIEKGIMNPSYEILLAIFRILPVSLDALILPRTTESECELRELSQIYLSCPEPVRKALLDSTRSLAMNLTEFYNKIESPGRRPSFPIADSICLLTRALRLNLHKSNAANGRMAD